MIVRIMTDNQYRLDDENLAEVHRLDDILERALDGGDAQGFTSALRELVDYVRQHGQVVPDEEVIPSDLMIPAPDMTLEEARSRLHTVDVKPNSGE